MDDGKPSVECDVCGGTDFYKESGHFYCNECQTQTQEIQEQVFEREEHTINKKATRKIRQQKSDKTTERLTSWECYNVILKGLTNELIELGAKSQLKNVVKCLWMKYLHKCEVFDIKSDKPPKVSVLGSKKDIDILYNRKRVKRKKRASSVSSLSTSLSVKRQRSRKKSALVQSHYEDISLSQSLTQNLSLVGETLSSVQSDSEQSDTKSLQINYNKFSKNELEKLMSKNHQKQHFLDTSGTMACHKFRSKDFTTKFSTSPAVLTIVTLYGLLYLSLLLIEDPIQLGDIFRFIREGHLSFGNFRHFFDENIKDEMLTLPPVQQKLFTNQTLRQKAGKLAKFLDIVQYVKTPDLKVLCERYCEELNLPDEVLACVHKVIIKSKPKASLLKTEREIPNYEGRALSFIIVVLKLLFGLDGITEKQFSLYAGELNSTELDVNMFDFKEWLKFIRCRNVVVQKYHLVSGLVDKVNAVDYINYYFNQDIAFKSDKRKLRREVEDYRRVLSLLNKGCESGVRFEANLIPFHYYTEVILNKFQLPCGNLLKRKFANDSLDFLLKPDKYLTLLGVKLVKNGGANDDIITEEILHHYLNTAFAWRKNSKIVTARISENTSSDQNVGEYLNLFRKTPMRTTDSDVLLHNWQKGNEKQFQLNRAAFQIWSEHVKLTNKKTASQIQYKQHFNPFERYWLNVPCSPTNSHLSKAQMNSIMGKMAPSLRTIVRECARISEQTLTEFYNEFLLTELCLVYCVDFGGKKSKNTDTVSLKAVLESCSRKW